MLVIDRLEIGDGETSASAVPLACLERLEPHRPHPAGAPRHRACTHGRRSQRLRLFDFATFDYRGLCEEMFARSGADFLRARVTGAGDGDGAHDGAGRFTAPIVIEAAGWRTSVPRGPARRRARAGRRSFGVESRRPLRGDGLHFYVGPAHGRRMFSWVFPAGDHVRAGLAAYDGRSSLSGDLASFLDRHGLGESGRHARRLLHLALRRARPRRACSWSATRRATACRSRARASAPRSSSVRSPGASPSGCAPAS